jgi:Flp pilus assembly pilin Flp
MARRTSAPGVSHLREAVSPTAFTEVAMQIALTVLDRFGGRNASTWLGRVPGLSRGEDGQDLLEYAVLCALIAIVALGAVQAVGNTVNDVFWSAIAASSV